MLLLSLPSIPWDPSVHSVVPSDLSNLSALSDLLAFPPIPWNLSDPSIPLDQ